MAAANHSAPRDGQEERTPARPVRQSRGCYTMEDITATSSTSSTSTTATSRTSSSSRRTTGDD